MRDWEAVVTNHSIGTCLFWVICTLPFETSGTASCGSTGKYRCKIDVYNFQTRLIISTYLVGGPEFGMRKSVSHGWSTYPPNVPPPEIRPYWGNQWLICPYQGLIGGGVGWLAKDLINQAQFLPSQTFLRRGSRFLLSYGFDGEHTVKIHKKPTALVEYNHQSPMGSIFTDLLT